MGPLLKTGYIDKLERVQRQATRFKTGDYKTREEGYKCHANAGNIRTVITGTTTQHQHGGCEVTGMVDGR